MVALGRGSLKLRTWRGCQLGPWGQNGQECTFQPHWFLARKQWLQPPESLFPLCKMGVAVVSASSGGLDDSAGLFEVPLARAAPGDQGERSLAGAARKGAAGLLWHVQAPPPKCCLWASRLDVNPVPIVLSGPCGLCLRESWKRAPGLQAALEGISNHGGRGQLPGPSPSLPSYWQ